MQGTLLLPCKRELATHPPTKGTCQRLAYGYCEPCVQRVKPFIAVPLVIERENAEFLHSLPATFWAGVSLMADFTGRNDRPHRQSRQQPRGSGHDQWPRGGQLLSRDIEDSGFAKGKLVLAGQRGRQLPVIVYAFAEYISQVFAGDDHRG